MKTQIEPLETQLETELARRDELARNLETVVADENAAKTALADGGGDVGALMTLSAQVVAVNDVLATLDTRIAATQASIAEERARIERVAHLERAGEIAAQAQIHLAEFAKARQKGGAALESALDSMHEAATKLWESRQSFTELAGAESIERVRDILRENGENTDGLTTQITPSFEPGAAPLPEAPGVNLIIGIFRRQVLERANQQREAKESEIRRRRADSAPSPNI